MNIQNQSTTNKVIVNFSVEAEMMVSSLPTLGGADVVGPLPGGSGTMSSGTLAEHAISRSVSSTPHYSMEFPAWESCGFSRDV
ncbi:hypothetical protein ARSEF1564_008886 [Beauveria bassiana]